MQTAYIWKSKESVRVLIYADHDGQSVIIDTYEDHGLVDVCNWLCRWYCDDTKPKIIREQYRIRELDHEWIAAQGD